MKKILFLLSILFVFINACKQESFPQEMEILTNDATDIQLYSAKINCNITYGDNNKEVKSRGIIWGDSSSPSFNSKVEKLGAGFGPFYTILDSLMDNKIYYARGFAITQNDTFYGNEISFRTKEDILKSAPCHPKKNELQFNQFNSRYNRVELEYYSTSFKIVGKTVDSDDIEVSFREVPLTGKYITVASTKELGENKCTAVFYEIKQYFNANVGDTVYVLNDGKGVFSVVFCGIEFTSKTSTSKYISDLYLTNNK